MVYKAIEFEECESGDCLYASNDGSQVGRSRIRRSSLKSANQEICLYAPKNKFSAQIC